MPDCVRCLPTETSYDPSCFESLARIEDQHFWFCTRRRVIATLASQITSRLPFGYRILEVGCGTGAVLRAIQEICANGMVFGMDLYAEGLRFAQRRCGPVLLQGDIHMPPFGLPFQLIGAFDVLEHLPDDSQVLRLCHSLLDSGGTLLLTVPAHPQLWSYFDEYSHHQRRYEVAELRQKLEASGYEIEYLTEYMAGIFPLLWMRRKAARHAIAGRQQDLDSFREQSELELKIVPVVNHALTALLSLEIKWIAKRRKLPFGGSLVAIARKR